MKTYSINQKGITDDRLIFMMHTMRIMARHNVPKILIKEYTKLINDYEYDKVIEITNAIIELCNKYGG